MLELITIFTLAWVLVLVGSAMIFEVIVPISFWNNFFYDSITKAVLVTILVLVWLYALLLLRDIAVKRSLFPKKKSQLANS